MITFFQAIIIGLLQGATELFPISSLGHSVIFAWLFNWREILTDQSQGESFYLSFLVALHVATALALLLFYKDTWIRIIKGFFHSVKTRKVTTADSKLAWLLILATIPAALVGLVFEHMLRTQFAKPLSAIVFLMINGGILLIGDRYQRQHPPAPISKDLKKTTRNVTGTLTVRRSMLIGTAQVGALMAGISRSGITMVSGLYSGLNNEDAARFSFLLATPIILGAGIYKLPDFFSGLDAGVRGQILVGAAAAGISAYLSVRFLDKYFQNSSLRPFGIYCLVFGGLMLGVGFFRGSF